MIEPWIDLDWGRAAQILLALTAVGIAFRAWARRHERERPERLEACFWGLAAGACTLTWWGVVLAEVGAFGIHALTLPPLLAGMVAAFVLRGDGGPDAPEPRPGSGVEVVGVVVVLVLAAGVYHPAFDVRVEARDPGVYELTGRHIARSGSLIIRDDFVSGLDPEVARYFFPPRPEPFDRGPYESFRYMGFYLESRDQGRVAPQFLPAYPVWVATWQTILDDPGGNQEAGPGSVKDLAGVAGSALGALGAIALVFAGARLAGPLAGGLAGMLLAGNFVQAWFARYSAAEMLGQFLILVAVGALAVERRNRNPAFGALSAVAFGLCWLTKAELLVLAAPLIFLLLSDAVRGEIDRRRALTFWLPLGLLAGHVFVHSALWARAYVHDLTLVLEVPSWALVAAPALGGGTLFVVLGRIGRWPPARRERWAALIDGRSVAGRWLRVAAVAAFVSMIIYGYWLRPSYRGWDRHNFPELVWAVSVPVAVLACLEIVRRVWTGRASARSPAAAGLVILFFAGAVFLLHRRINPGLLWAYRRWVPALIPATLLLGAAGWAHWWSVARRRVDSPAGRAAAGILAIGLLGVAVVVGLETRAMAQRYDETPELAGATEMLAQVEEVLPERSVVLFEPRARFGLLRLEAPLALDLGHDVLRIPDPEVDPEMVHQVIWSAARQGRATYLLTTGYLDRWRGPGAIPVQQFHWVIEKLQEEPRQLPGEMETLRISASLYRLEPFGGLAELPGRLDVGHWDDLYVKGTTVYAPERDGSGRTFRWTRDESVFWLPGLGSEADVLAVMMGSDARPGMEAQVVQILLDGRLLGRVVLEPGWREYRVPIAETWQDGASFPEVRLRTDSFQPREFGIPDGRDLGIKIDWIGWADLDRPPG